MQVFPPNPFLNLYVYTCMLKRWFYFFVPCVFVRKTTWNLLKPITQQIGRKHLQRLRSLCALCMTPHAFYFSTLSSAIFTLSPSLPPSLSLSTLKSCTVFLSRSELLQTCSAIRNCEFFLIKTFFVVFHFVWVFCLFEENLII